MGTIKCDYAGKPGYLRVKKDDVVEIRHQETDFLYCRSAGGDVGWLSDAIVDVFWED
jgi:hypothetical protein